MKIADVARIAYEAVRAYGMTVGHHHHRKWRNLTPDHQQSLIDGALFHFVNPEIGPEAAHLARCKKLMEKGWQWGPVKAEEDKQTPLLVPYDQLPEARQMKYFLFCVVAGNLAQYVEDGPEPPQKQGLEAITDPLSAIVGAPLVEGETPHVGVGGAAPQGESGQSPENSSDSSSEGQGSSSQASSTTSGDTESQSTETESASTPETSASTEPSQTTEDSPATEEAAA